MIEIAIVDDEQMLVDSLRLSLEYWGYSVVTFGEGAPFLEYSKHSQPDIVFLDINLPDMNGMDILRQLAESEKAIATVMITAHGNMKSAIQAMKLGAYDYVNKPFELDEIKLLIEKAVDEMRLVREVEHRRERDYKGSTLDTIIGESQPMQTLLQQVRTVARVDDTTVLMRGESGTGKDLLAKAIHNLSGRSGRQFIEINCASFPENLLESELFGYEKGAFTDAKQRKIGLIELADGGTLFLDEVGELPLFLQAKLLKFIESKSFRRVGGTGEISVDVRIVSATNRNLEEEVANGNFREDLFYRLNVVPLTVPPLRERGDDVLLIAGYYLELFSRKFGKETVCLGDEAAQAFRVYGWPGNVRELRNLCERLVILTPESVVEYGQIPAEMSRRIADPCELMRRFDTPDAGIEAVLDAIEHELITNALKKTGGVKQDAAEALKISRHALLRRMKRLGMEE